MQALSDAIQKVGAAMYQQEEPAPGNTTEPGGEPGKTEPNPGPVDAEYKEVPKE